MLEETLKSILGKYSRKGFELSEIDDHTLELSFQGQAITIIGTLGLRDRGELAEIIQDSCQEHAALLARAGELALQTERLSRECQSPLLSLNSLCSQTRRGDR